MDAALQVINTVRPQYEAGAEDLTLRKRMLSQMIRQKGNIEYNQGGDRCYWQLDYKENEAESYVDGGTIDFPNNNYWMRISTDWRAIIAKDSLTLLQHAMNSGRDTQLIQLFQEKSNKLLDGMQKSFNKGYFINTGTTGYEAWPDGIETFLTETTPAATDIVATPNDTYGLESKSTVLGTYGGTWSSGLSTYPNATLAKDWPYGNGDPEYDFLSPKLVNWSSTNWGTGSATWEDNCWRVITTTHLWLQMNTSADDLPGLILLASNLLDGVKRSQETYRQIMISQYRPGQDFGFPGAVQIDGVPLETDFDVPVNTGYGFNLNRVKISCLFDKLFKLLHGADTSNAKMNTFIQNMDLRNLAMLMLMIFAGNYKWQPKYVAKLKNYA